MPARVWTPVASSSRTTIGGLPTARTAPSYCHTGWARSHPPGRTDFIKLGCASVGPGEEIVIPPNDDVILRRAAGAAQFSEHGFAVDYEVEFGVVLGSRAKNVPREEALDHVFGYTVFNDVGARSVQFHNGQRDLGKNFDCGTFMQPPRFLQPGDVVTVSANGIGKLTNPVVQATALTR
ncbi:MAG: fumarylacetoacetate hydrolase family protein [Gaiella sp.]